MFIVLYLYIYSLCLYCFSGDGQEEKGTETDKAGAVSIQNAIYLVDTIPE